jgi:hypothetical protein
MRTDLDSFTDVEAYALMASGYTLALLDLVAAVTTTAAPQQPDGGWPFQPVLTAIAAGRTRELRRELEVSRQRAWKLWRLMLSRGPHDARSKPSRLSRLPARLRNGAYRVGTGVTIGVVGTVVGGLHLALFDRRYLARGRVGTLRD